jgi:hypothetical protein
MPENRLAANRWESREPRFVLGSPAALMIWKITGGACAEGATDCQPRIATAVAILGHRSNEGEPGKGSGTGAQSHT